MNARILPSCLLALLAGIIVPSAHAAESRSIAGEWRLALDPANVGEKQRWFAGDLPGASTITLPRPILDARPGGVYWLQYTLMIPGSWKDKQVSLLLERVEDATRVWIDDSELPGIQDSLVTPHIHPLGALGRPATRRLTIRLEPPKAGTTRVTGPGLFGALEIRGVDPLAIEDVQAFPDLSLQRARVRVRLSNASGSTLPARLKLTVHSRPGAPALTLDETPVTIAETTEAVRDLNLGPGAKPWDLASRTIYLLKVAVTASAAGKTFSDERAVRFGLRRFERRDSDYHLNGRPMAFHEVDLATIVPRGGVSLTSQAEWRRGFRGLAAQGANLARFDGWCPPEAAFAAADLEGIILQVGASEVNPSAEVPRILELYGNHPCFCLMVLPVEHLVDNPLSSAGVGKLRQEDPRRVYLCSGPPGGR